MSAFIFVPSYFCLRCFWRFMQTKHFNEHPTAALNASRSGSSSRCQVGQSTTSTAPVFRRGAAGLKHSISARPFPQSISPLAASTPLPRLPLTLNSLSSLYESRVKPKHRVYIFFNFSSWKRHSEDIIDDSDLLMLFYIAGLLSADASIVICPCCRLFLPSRYKWIILLNCSVCYLCMVAIILTSPDFPWTASYFHTG